MKIKDVIGKVLDYHPKFPKEYAGCDEYKCGDPEDECTGIICAMAPTIHVIRKAIEEKANLIIVHEPTFYTSADKGGWYEEFDNAVYQEKRKLLDDNGICIWRDHDHMHAHRPDSIFTGVLKYLGWEDKARLDPDTGMYAHYLVTTEPQKVRDVADHLIDTIGLNGCRIVGDEDMEVTKIALVGHLFPEYYTKKDGSKGEYSVRVIETLEKWADVIIPGEVIDWTTLSYIRDAWQLGKKKAAICIGHFNWEELGMRYYKDWLSELLDKEMKVTYVPSEDMYQYYVKGGNGSC
ncbi:MAG: Nif3-like dinuclear metal center hexameric protein [Erysipelotrichaceae bacterium]|nr:Nif3-like dinuclear metal center hexameric protein [Erysipelotrichaceae bacterium]